MSTWLEILHAEKEKSYFKEIIRKLDIEYATEVVYPPRAQIFNALDTPLCNIKVVILGQDPYHNPGEAHGLSFSVMKGIKIPPSLRNIYKELFDDVGILPKHGNLDTWAQQGVCLLNTSLTVRHQQPRSHHYLGWNQLTQKIISTISTHQEYVVFILWGKDAQSRRHLIDNRHGVIESVHPSPLSAYRGFFGSKPFSTTNRLLTDHNTTPIDWSIPE